MNIALITHYMPPHQGGIERVAKTLYEAYKQAEFKTRWLASRAPASASPRDEGLVRVHCSNLLEERFGVPLPLWGVEGVREVARLCAWADVVHAHDCLYPGSFIAALSTYRAGAPLLLTQHVGHVPYTSRILNLMEWVGYQTLGRFVASRASLVVAATPAAETFLFNRLRCSPSRCRTIPNGIDLGRFHPATSEERSTARIALGLPVDRPIVLFVGRFVEKKGLERVLAAHRLLPEYHLLLIGDGPLASLVSREGSNITWLSRVAPDEMPRCFHAADCLLLPSRGEGLPLVVQEAMASAVPAVLSDSEQFARILGADRVAFTSSPDPDTLAENVLAAVTEAKQEAFRERIRAYAVTTWDIRAMTSAYIELVHQLARKASQDA